MSLRLVSSPPSSRSLPDSEAYLIAFALRAEPAEHVGVEPQRHVRLAARTASPHPSPLLPTLLDRLRQFSRLGAVFDRQMKRAAAALLVENFNFLDDPDLDELF